MHVESILNLGYPVFDMVTGVHTSGTWKPWGRWTARPQTIHSRWWWTSWAKRTTPFENIRRLYPNGHSNPVSVCHSFSVIYKLFSCFRECLLWFDFCWSAVYSQCKLPIYSRYGSPTFTQALEKPSNILLENKFVSASLRTRHVKHLTTLKNVDCLSMNQSTQLHYTNHQTNYKIEKH